MKSEQLVKSLVKHGDKLLIDMKQRQLLQQRFKTVFHLQYQSALAHLRKVGNLNCQSV